MFTTLALVSLAASTGQDPAGVTAEPRPMSHGLPDVGWSRVRRSSGVKGTTAALYCFGARP